jgi:catechol 2,3-dioxygenase-like lactoylglutathione lyase family enzyme
MNPVYSHVDLRVRDLPRAIAFYDIVLGSLGHMRSESEVWVTYLAAARNGEPDASVWFGFTADPQMRPNETRIAFYAASSDDVDRAAQAAADAGAKHMEGPEYAYGPNYYAVFFEDPDGNKLEVCCYGPAARSAS